uniref:5'-nucleotidase n=1 Tax=OCS116 cluster bacterium TaxID=2030921 RepID=A0A2A4YTU5_9PROT
MPLELSETLVIGVSATALFDLSAAAEVFKKKSKSNPETAIAEYRKYMLEHEEEELLPGTAMPLVRSLLALNKDQEDGEPAIVEVIVISRNSPETGYRVLREIRRQKIDITRSAFTAGEKSYRYLDAFYVDLFLTTNEEDAQEIANLNLCAAAIVKNPPNLEENLTDEQVRFAFDADAVIFSDESEVVNQEEGLSAFHENEDRKQDIPLNKGPHANLLLKLSKIRERLPGSLEYSPIRLAIFTARNSPAEMRVINTLRSWGIYVDKMFFLGGLQKSRFLKVFKPHIFFDDQDGHLDSAAGDVPSAKVLYSKFSPLKALIDNSN